MEFAAVLVSCRCINSIVFILFLEPQKPEIVCQPDKILAKIQTPEEYGVITVKVCSQWGHCGTPCVFHNIPTTGRLECNLVNITTATMLRTYQVQVIFQKANGSNTVEISGPVFSYYTCKYTALAACVSKI